MTNTATWYHVNITYTIDGIRNASTIRVKTDTRLNAKLIGLGRFADNHAGARGTSRRIVVLSATV